MLKAEGTSNSDMESAHYGFPSPDVEEEALEALVNEWKQDAGAPTSLWKPVKRVWVVHRAFGYPCTPVPQTAAKECLWSLSTHRPLLL